MGINVKNISKSYKDFKVLENINLEVKSGELLALLGPSGSGKTTLLRIIAGLEFPDNGSVILDGEEAVNKHVKERQVGFVFQHYALFKHMSVFENVAFGLKVRPKETRPSKEEIEHKVMELLRLVHLDAFHNRYPSQLSGGQRQRVALARALAVEPKVLLLDEPFGALDAKVRKELRHWMRRLHDEIHITSIFVTHDQEEAMEVSDRVVVMSNGRVEQVGTPEEVYYSPANSFVYDFLGNYNQFEGMMNEDGDIHLTDADVFESRKSKIILPANQTQGWLSRYPMVENLVGKILPNAKIEDKNAPKTKGRKKKSANAKPVKIFSRPHEMYVHKNIPANDENDYISAKLVHLNPTGSLVKLELERKNQTIIQAEISKSVLDNLKVKKGDTLFVRPKNYKVFG
jgi:sulfate transport system ATP-binding protein